MCSVWATPQEQKMSRLIYSKGANKGQTKKKKKKRAAKSADAHVTKKGGFEMMGRRTRGSNCNSQCQTKHKTQSGANYNANTKVHKLANLRFFSSGGDWRWWWWWCWKKPNKQDQIKRKRTEFLSARTSRPLCTHKYKCFLVWNRHKKWEIKKKKKENTQPTNRQKHQWELNRRRRLCPCHFGCHCGGKTLWGRLNFPGAIQVPQKASG